MNTIAAAMIDPAHAPKGINEDIIFKENMMTTQIPAPDEIPNK